MPKKLPIKGRRYRPRKTVRPRGSALGRRRDADPVMDHVRARIKLRRTGGEMNFTQHALDDALGVPHGTVAGMENGSRRVTASHLLRLSHILDVPVSFFFDDMPGSVAERSVRTRGGRELASMVVGKDPLAKAETQELVRAYYAIPEARVRRDLFRMIKAVAIGEESE